MRMGENRRHRDVQVARDQMSVRQHVAEDTADQRDDGADHRQPRIAATEPFDREAYEKADPIATNPMR